VSVVQEEYDEPSSLDGWPGDFRLGLAGYGFGGHRTLWLRNMLHDRETRNGLPLAFVENLKIVLRKVAYRTFL
jgi:hypothetical protein